MVMSKLLISTVSIGFILIKCDYIIFALCAYRYAHFVTRRDIVFENKNNKIKFKKKRIFSKRFQTVRSQ